jgi:hypothetical protein
MLLKKLKNDRNTSFLQQVYNSPLTWGGLHTLWGPSYVKGLLYTCCKSVVRESVLKKIRVRLHSLTLLVQVDNCEIKMR